MTNKQTLLLLPGDGIGPEVTEEACRVAKHVAPDLQIEEAYFGGVSYDQFGTPLTDEVMAQARKSDAILMGAVGGPKWDGVPRDKLDDRLRRPLQGEHARCHGVTLLLGLPHGDRLPRIGGVHDEGRWHRDRYAAPR